MHTVVAPLLVAVDDRFGVGPGAILVAAPLELLAHIGVVVYLAVENDPDAAVLIRQRLLPGAQIDDAEAPVREHRPCIHVETRGVGPPVRDDVAHAHGARRSVLIKRIDCHDSRNPAHDYAASSAPLASPLTPGARRSAAASSEGGKARVPSATRAPPRSTNCLNHNSSITRLHRRWRWSCRPSRCSRHRPATVR